MQIVHVSHVNTPLDLLYGLHNHWEESGQTHGRLIHLLKPVIGQRQDLEIMDDILPTWMKGQDEFCPLLDEQAINKMD